MLLITYFSYLCPCALNEPDSHSLLISLYVSSLQSLLHVAHYISWTFCNPLACILACGVGCGMMLATWQEAESQQILLKIFGSLLCHLKQWTCPLLSGLYQLFLSACVMGTVDVLCVCVPLPHQPIHTWCIQCNQGAIRLFVAFSVLSCRAAITITVYMHISIEILGAPCARFS